MKNIADIRCFSHFISLNRKIKCFEKKNGVPQ